MVSPNSPETPGGAASNSAAPRSIQDVVIRLAGNSQDGIQSVGGFLARLAGRSDQDVMTYMTIPSTISGGPSIFQVRMGTGDILSAGDRADMLVAFYQHSYDAHIGSLRPGGVLVYDSDHVKPVEGDNRFTNVAVPITSAETAVEKPTASDTRPPASTRASMSGERRRLKAATASVQPDSMSCHNNNEPSWPPQVAATRKGQGSRPLACWLT